MPNVDKKPVICIKGNFLEI